MLAARYIHITVLSSCLACLALAAYSLTFPDCNAEWLNRLSSALPELKNLLPVSHHKLVAYARTRYALHFCFVLLEMVFTFLFLQLGLARQLSEFIGKRITKRTLHTAVFVLSYAAIMWSLFFPLSCFSSFGLKHYYGLSGQHFVDWLTDQGKAFLLGIAIALPIWCAAYWALRRFKKAWPYVIFACSIPVIFGMTFAAPLLIDPVFNKITPMPENGLRKEISLLAAKAGIAEAPVFTSDRSKQTNEINAYVTGIGQSARIVVWDTTLKKLAPEETISVVAHELGHYVLQHVYKGCAIAVVISLLAVPLNVLITPLLFQHAPKEWRISSIQDVTGLPFILLLSTIVTFWTEPLINSYSRLIESEADRYGYSIMPNKTAFIKTFCALSRENLSELAPPPVVTFWLFSHPPLGDRIAAVQNEAR